MNSTSCFQEVAPYNIGFSHHPLVPWSPGPNVSSVEAADSGHDQSLQTPSPIVRISLANREEVINPRNG